jgi:hypothetical protein
LLVLLAAIACEHAREPSVVVRELIVIDAGSSGTRARVFRFEPGRPDTLVGLGRACENDRPLARDIAGVLDSHACALELLADASAPVLVYATGGMRSLAEHDAKAAARRHAEVVAALRERGVLDVESRTISGSDEAFYEWLGVNHQEGRLGGGETVTMLEFGGASVQVAFEVEPALALVLAPDELRALDLVGDERDAPRRVFVRSYLHCGMNEARETLAAATCFPPGCADAPRCAAMQPDTATPPTGGAATSCRAAIGVALAHADSSCAAVQELPPSLPRARPIRLISRLADTFVALGVVDGTHVDVRAAIAAAERVCATPWSDASEPGLCFAANHALVVLAAWGIGASDDRVTVTAIDHSWTWGVAREQVERPP